MSDPILIALVAEVVMERARARRDKGQGEKSVEAALASQYYRET